MTLPSRIATDAFVSGAPAVRRRVRRILCIKPDHIGDLLIAAPALMLLRKSFPDAHITLVCGPWNVGLARRLGIADEVHATSLFAQNSLGDMDRAERERRRTEAKEALKALELDAFDLAIDLRRDEDTRELLKLFDADIRIGFGDLLTYSYLDVALPVTHRGYETGVTSLSLDAHALDGGMGHRIDQHGLRLTARHARLDLDLFTDAVWPPTDEGVNDNRLLGAALSRIDMRQAAGTGDRGGRLIELPRDSMRFGAGWLDWEPWGRWSTVNRASFSIQIPMATDDAVELLVRVQGHTAPSHPEALVLVSSGGAEASHRFRTGDEAATLRLMCQVAGEPPVARSDPFLLRGGRYQGRLRLWLADISDWRALVLTVRGARPEDVIARLALPDRVDGAGTIDFPFEAELRDSAEPVVVEVAAPGIAPDEACRVAIVAVDLHCMQARSPELPIAHMERQLLDLAAMAALRYAPAIQAPGNDVADRLRARNSGSTAREPVARLKRRRGRWRGRTLVGIGIGANKETKLWPRASFVALCRMILARPRTDIVFIGGPAEKAEVQTLMDALQAGDRALDLTGCCRIEDLGEVLAALDGFVGLDTGTTHYAGRVGLPTVALFGRSHDPAIWGPVGENAAWAAVDMACGGCSLSQAAQCPVDLRCMTGLTPEDVWPLVERTIFAARLIARTDAG